MISVLPKPLTTSFREEFCVVDPTDGLEITTGEQFILGDEPVSVRTNDPDFGLFNLSNSVGVDAFVARMQGRSVKALQVCGSLIVGEDVKRVAAALFRDGAVTALECKGPHINLRAVAEAVSGQPNNSLRILNLSNCAITDGDIPHLVKVLKCCPALEALILHQNSIGGEGVRPLVDVLKGSRVRVLDLSWNPLFSGAAVIAELLGEKGILTHLHLDMCPLDDPGVETLSQAMERSQTIRYLSAEWRNFSGASIQRLARVPKDNSSLSDLRV